MDSIFSFYSILEEFTSESSLRSETASNDLALHVLLMVHHHGLQEQAMCLK